MAAVFISYTRVDYARAKVLARAIKAAGYTVWWDQELESGESFGPEIEQQLTDAVCVIVLWSRTSVTRPWVRAEARWGHDMNKLVPLALDDCTLPLPFGELHTPRLPDGKLEGTAFLEKLRARIAWHVAHPGEVRRDEGRAAADVQAPVVTRLRDAPWSARRARLAAAAVVPMVVVVLAVATSPTGYGAWIFSPQSLQSSKAQNSPQPLQSPESPVSAMRAQAHEYVVRGKEVSSRSWSRMDAEKAVELFRKAVATDSNYALAWAWLARAHAWMYRMRFDHTENRVVVAQRAADHAVALDSGLAEARIARGLYYAWVHDDYERAVGEYKVAAAIEPDSAEPLLQIGNARRRQGRFDEAIASYQQATRADSMSYRTWFGLGETLMFVRRYDDARVPLERATAYAPEFLQGYVQRMRLALNTGNDVAVARAILDTVETRVSPNNWRLPMLEYARIVDADPEALLVRVQSRRYGLDSTLYHCAQGKILWQLGRKAAARIQFDSARVRLERLREDQPGEPWVFEMLGIAHAGLGHAGEAVRWATRAQELRPLDRDAFEGPGVLETIGLVYAMLGDTRRAVAVFESTLARPSWTSEHWLQTEPLLAELRRDAAFQQLLTRRASH
jgi:tetratricopeptide (TPR) repeat protein